MPPPTSTCEAPETESRSESPALALPSYFAYQTPIHRALAALLLLPGSLVIALLWCLVKLTSRGSGFYSQQRVGRDGRIFVCHKLRTMVHDAEQKTGAVWSQKNDDRVTWLGEWLRRSHLDELPQLWNVVRGDMALVGPRPERPELTPGLESQVAEYAQRLKVRPGITGISQLTLPPDQDINDVRQKLVGDFEYIERGSLWLDVRILGCTVIKALGLPRRYLLPMVYGLGITRAAPAASESQSPKVHALETAENPRAERPKRMLVKSINRRAR